MENGKIKYTRGNGMLEHWLARLRSNKANQLIPDHLRQGRIIDIGCGSYPYFLSHTFFAEKFAVEQHHTENKISNISWHSIDLNRAQPFPFADHYFSAATMLAVVEHLDPNSLVEVFKETYRILQPGGVLIITTPAAWSDNLLHFMARLRLVSTEEINEHVYNYTLPLMGWYFGRAGFAMDKIRFGYFELMLNLWAVAVR